MKEKLSKFKIVLIISLVLVIMATVAGIVYAATGSTNGETKPVQCSENCTNGNSSQCQGTCDMGTTKNNTQSCDGKCSGTGSGSCCDTNAGGQTRTQTNTGGMNCGGTCGR